MILSLIPAEAMPELWPVAAPLIQKAIDAAPGYYRVIDVLDGILREKETLWGVFDEDGKMTACFTLVIDQYPLCKRLRIHHAGGAELDIWQDECFEILKNYARDTGCSGIDAKGRDGWRKRARERDWKIASMFSVELEN